MYVHFHSQTGYSSSQPVNTLAGRSSSLEEPVNLAAVCILYENGSINHFLSFVRTVTGPRREESEREGKSSA